MRVLFLGEIVGKAGHMTVKSTLKKTVIENQVDYVIANVNGATGGYGLGKNHAIILKKRGVDVLTGGENIYNKKDIVGFLPKMPWILRPANLPQGIPGRGWGIYDTPAGPLGIICMIGQSGFLRMHGNNPFTYLPEIVRRIREHTRRIILNFHALTTAEKRSMAFHSNGLVSAMVGTGTRCLTADAEILSCGTGVITDAGRTGSRQSLYGMDTNTELQILLSRVPGRSQDGWGNLRMQGVLMELDSEGRTVSIIPMDIPNEEEDHVLPGPSH